MPRAPATALLNTRAVPSWLLPIWLPLILAAIVSGALLAWLVPPESSGAAPPSLRFAEITKEAGITFVQRAGADADATPTTLGGGVVVFDYDVDGDPDLFFVNGTEWPWEESLAKRVSSNRCALYRNDGTGRFTDVSALAGLNLEFQGMAAAAGDFDGDGLPDLYLTGVGSSHLFRNRGGGRFEDVTEQAGVGGDDNAWSTGAAWIDVDGDGRLDLVVCHYARWPREVGLDGAFAVALMGRSYGTPTGFVGTPPTVYSNLGDGHFEPVPGAAGLVARDEQTGLPVARALAVMPGDANNDGRPDLLLTFHTHEPVLFLNQGAGVFRRWTGSGGERREGAAVFPVPFLQAGGGDDRVRLLYAFEVEPAGGIDESPFVSLESRLGLVLGDFDRDGRLEAFSGNGRAERDINQFNAGRELAARPRLLWRGEGGMWMPVPERDDSSWDRPITARGVATADLDGDGDLDVIVSQFGGAPVLLRNESADDTPWLAIDLVAGPGARDPGGARVEVHTPRRVHVQTWVPAMGLFAQSASTLHFGLGEDMRVRRVVVIRPDGGRTELRPERINQRLTIRMP